MFVLTLPVAGQWPGRGMSPEALLAAFGQMTVRERHASYRSQSSEVKSTLWRLQLRSFANEHPNLTQRQRSFLDRAEQALVPSAFVQDSEQSHNAKALCAQASEVFERAELTALNLLGGPVRPLLTALPSRQSSLGLTPWVTVAAAASRFGPCDCNTSTSCTLCQLVSICLPRESFCTYQSSGCGCFWLEECDGFCWTPGLRP